MPFPSKHLIDPSVMRQSAKPTTRSDGSPLQVGDQWIQAGALANFEWFWNGQYWLSRQIQYARFATAGTTSSGIGETNIFEPESGFGLWLHDAKFIWRASAANDDTSFFTLAVSRRNEPGLTTSIFSAVTSGTASSAKIVRIIPNEFLLDVDALGIQVLRFSATRTGTTATLTAAKIILPMRLANLN